MTAHLIGHAHGFDLFERASGRVDAWCGSEWAGCVADLGRPDAAVWVARRGDSADQDLTRFASRHRALAWLLGGCPDCVCGPLCAEDESGDSCLDCGACLNGCPEDECDMRKEPLRG